MSIQAINNYYLELEKMIHYGGSKKETAIRSSFYNLLNQYATQKGLFLVQELTIKAPSGKNITPDGTLKDSLRLDWGYWESKDTADTLDAEISNKFDKGYPKDNILFENSEMAVLYQNGIETARVDMRNPLQLDEILKSFVNYQRPEVVEFRKAIELFKDDVPKVSDALRELIREAETVNLVFVGKRTEFLEVCQEAINPDVTVEDVNEMIIQYILTADIFNTIFDEPYFHRENNIAQQLEQVIESFFTRQIRNTLLSQIDQYYKAINAAAAGIADHHEKQNFLKIVYETFYKSYNPKAADRLGVVYTPNEIVRFKIEAVDHLLYKHFGKFIYDKNVEILDPATGTGTYICELIDYMPKDKLEYKYKNEIHANEVAILPYYIANLNIEFTYKQKMGAYAEFLNLCFVDTLDNMGFDYKDKQENIFGISAENTERIKKQNERKISVIIGNPPYNANQMNENDNNKNREYGEIDKRIKNTYIKNSTAQKTKMYDMYARFFRWAMDRLGDEGIIAFITNRSFINSRTFDGFRKIVQEDFDYCYIIDTRSDVRANPKIAGTTHNVFGIQTGVAVMFLIKQEIKQKCKIFYFTLTDEMRKEEKLDWFAYNKIDKIPFEHITPDKNSNWLDLTDNDWDELIPVANKETKLSKSKNDENTIFKLYSLGVVSNRDEWVYDYNLNNLKEKIMYFYSSYERTRLSVEKDNINFDINSLNQDIKWTRDLKKDLKSNKILEMNDNEFTKSNFRPFIIFDYYFNDDINEMLYRMKEIFPTNYCISIKGPGMEHPFHSIVTKYIPHLQFTPNGQCLPLYRYDTDGNRIDNITDWGLEQFRNRYEITDPQSPNPDPRITKEDIFHYVYGVLHNPEYRKKYEMNLKREFPRVPFYDDFWQWASWGRELMDLHINFETVEPFPLEVIEQEFTYDREPKAKLKADKTSGTITLDEITTLAGIPSEVWEYKLGNRSALEWILDQYKEKKPKDPTIAEKFNTYRFADYKSKVIDLLMRVTTVSVETVRIVKEMEKE
jgi:predicted helicase